MGCGKNPQNEFATYREFFPQIGHEFIFYSPTQCCGSTGGPDGSLSLSRIYWIQISKRVEWSADIKIFQTLMLLLEILLGIQIFPGIRTAALFVSGISTNWNTQSSKTTPTVNVAYIFSTNWNTQSSKTTPTVNFAFTFSTNRNTWSSKTTPTMNVAFMFSTDRQ